MAARNTDRAVLRLVVLVLSLALLAAACGGDDAEETSDAKSPEAKRSPAAVKSDKVLTIGSLTPQTGDLAVLGPPQAKAIQLAVQDINEAGGVNGAPVKLLEADDGTNEDVAADSVTKLLDDNVDAIIGAAGSTISLAVIDEITGAGVVQCSPSNTGAVFTTYEDAGLYFRTAPPDNLQASVLSDKIIADGKSKIAIIALNNDYGKPFAELLETDLSEGGAEVVETVLYDPKGTNFDADVTKIKDASPDSVVVIAYPDTGAKILASMIEQGVGPQDVAVYVTDGLQSSDLAESVNPDDPSVLQGVVGTAATSAGSAEFTTAFEAFAPGVDQIYSAHAYDCVNIIALAAVKAKSDSPTDFASEINEITQNGEKCTSFASCKDLLDEGKDIDYEGASGPLDFIDVGEPAAGTYDVYQFGTDGKFTTIDTVDVKAD
jgi:branched-chain amino acid transport system substrate-binding protein